MYVALLKFLDCAAYCAITKKGAAIVKFQVHHGWATAETPNKTITTTKTTTTTT